MKDYEYNYPAYINIPFFVLKDKKLDAFNKLLFSLFWGFSVAGKKIVTSNGYLATCLNAGERHIQTGLKHLEDIGYIRRVTSNNRRRIEVLYTVSMPADFEESPEPDPQTKLKIVEKPSDLGGRSTDRPPHDPQIVPPRSTDRPYIKAYTKEDIKEKPTPEKIAPAKAESDKSFLMTLEDTLKDNPYNIPSQMLAEWLVIRKKRKCPLTHTAWTRTLKVLTQLVNSGLDAIDCFERMVANGWQGMEVRYFEQEIKSTTVISKVDIDKEIRARELKAQEEKRREIDASKSFLNLVTEAEKRSKHIGSSNIMEMQEAERRQLGMNAMQYHQHILKQGNR